MKTKTYVVLKDPVTRTYGVYVSQGSNGQVLVEGGFFHRDFADLCRDNLQAAEIAAYYKTVRAQLPNPLPDPQDEGIVQGAIQGLWHEGFSEADAVAFLSNIEECNATIPEAVALKNMANIRARHEARVAKP